MCRKLFLFFFRKSWNFRKTKENREKCRQKKAPMGMALLSMRRKRLDLE